MSNPIFSDDAAISEASAVVLRLLADYIDAARERTPEGVYLDDQDDVLWLFMTAHGPRLAWATEPPHPQSSVVSWPLESKQRPSLDAHAYAIAVELVEEGVDITGPLSRVPQVA